MNNKEEALAQLRLHRRKVIDLLQESARLHEASQNLSSYAERIEAQKRIIALNEEAFAEKAIADEFLIQINSITDEE